MLTFIRRIWHRDYWWAEFWSAVPSIGWATIGTLTDNGRIPSAFSVLIQIAPPWLWNGMLICVGLFQLIALALDDRWARVIAAAVMSWAWSCILLSVMEAAPHTRAIALYSGIIGINLVALARQLSHALDTVHIRGFNHGRR